MSNKLGRPRKYSKSKERYAVANKRRPVIRVTPEEKHVLKYLRKNPLIFKGLKDTISKVVTTTTGEVTRNDKVVTTVPITFPVTFQRMEDFIKLRGYDGIFEITGKRSRNKKAQWRYLCKMGKAI